jgi:heme-degrading monooxygenase HmoA
MFSVIFEVRPKPERWNTYLDIAKMLRPELERVDGFIDNVRYRSLRREGWILSLSGWRDRKLWSDGARRYGTTWRRRKVVPKSCSTIISAVGQITWDTRIPDGFSLQDQRLDETEVGAAKTVTLINGNRPPEWLNQANPDDVARWLGLAPPAPGLVAWDVFDAVLTPGDIILLVSWKDKANAEGFQHGVLLQDGARFRRVRVIRDYGMFDRREAPQYYPDAKGAPTVHA